MFSQRQMTMAGLYSHIPATQLKFLAPHSSNSLTLREVDFLLVNHDWRTVPAFRI